MDYLMQGIIALSETLTPSLSPSPLSGVSQGEPQKQSDVEADKIADLQLSLDAELDLMWEKIQELKETDMLAAQVMYEKYRAKAGDIPPPIPSHILEDQAVS